MRDLFRGYYRPTEAESADLWQKCIFSFDANVLLHIYSYTTPTRERFFEIINEIQDRIWIPYQVGYEYQNNRLKVILRELEAYAEIQRVLDESLQKLTQNLDKYRYHSSINTNHIIKTLERAVKRVKSDLNKASQAHPDLLQFDDVREKITKILAEKVGEPYSEDDLEEIFKAAEQRFSDKKPPGYKDAAKSTSAKYGDAVLWFELIQYAKLQARPLIFVTDDMKEDWWLEYEGKIISPRPELVQEMSTKAGVEFYMYSADEFMAYAEEFLELTAQQEAIKEAREIRLQDAAQQGRIGQSSLLRSVEYDSLNKTLEIHFHRGEVYQYIGVPSSAYKSLINAQSHGKHFHTYIKGIYPHRKLR